MTGLADQQKELRLCRLAAYAAQWTFIRKNRVPWGSFVSRVIRVALLAAGSGNFFSLANNRFLRPRLSLVECPDDKNNSCALSHARNESTTCGSGFDPDH